MKYIFAYFIIALLALVIGIAVLFGILSLPESPTVEKNVFDEIYGSLTETTEPTVERFNVCKVLSATATEADVLQCNNKAYPALSNDDRLYILGNKENETITFRYCRESEGTECTYTYFYKEKTLAYETNDNSETEPDPFLFNLLLPAWIDNTDGRSDFSYGEWGDYRLVSSK